MYLHAIYCIFYYPLFNESEILCMLLNFQKLRVDFGLFRTTTTTPIYINVNLKLPTLLLLLLLCILMLG